MPAPPDAALPAIAYITKDRGCCVPSKGGIGTNLQCPIKERKCSIQSL